MKTFLFYVSIIFTLGLSAIIMLARYTLTGDSSSFIVCLIFLILFIIFNVAINSWFDDYQIEIRKRTISYLFSYLKFIFKLKMLGSCWDYIYNYIGYNNFKDKWEKVNDAEIMWLSEALNSRISRNNLLTLGRLKRRHQTTNNKEKIKEIIKGYAFNYFIGWKSLKN